MFQDEAQQMQASETASGSESCLAAWVSRKGKSLMLSASNVVPFPARPRVRAVSVRGGRGAIPPGSSLGV